MHPTSTPTHEAAGHLHGGDLMSTPTTSAGTAVPVDVEHLHRIRNGVRAVLVLGVAASVAANVLHAEPTMVGRAIGAWSPLALLLTVELISRVPVHSLALSVLRMASTALIAGIAAWVSYWHMVSVASRNGESATSAHLLPLSVDGLVVVASVSLVEIAARLHHANTAPAEAEPTVPSPVTVPEPALAPEPEPEPVTMPEPSPKPEPEPAEVTQPRAKTPARRPAVRSAAEKVTRLRARYPEWTVGQIAAKAGVTERTARRHLNTAPAPAGPVVEPGPADDIAA